MFKSPSPLVLSVVLAAGLVPASVHAAAGAASQPASIPASQPASMPASQPASDAAAPSGPASQPNSGAASMPAAPAETAPKGSAVAPDEPAPVRVAGDAPARADDGAGNAFLDAFRSAVPRPSAGTYSDRPGFADTASILPSGAGVVMLGIGAAATTSDTLLLRAGKLTLPDVRLRFGVFDVLEAEAGLVYDLVAPTEFDAIAPGRVSAATLGGRILVMEEGGFWPGAAVAVRFYLPTQTLVFDETGLEARAMIQKTFLQRVTLSSNAGLTYLGADEQLGAFGSGALTAALGLGLSVYAEGIVQTALALPVNFAPAVLAQMGGAYDVSDWLRLDVSTNVELMPTFGSWNISAGATMYFPGHLWGMLK